MDYSGAQGELQDGGVIASEETGFSTAAGSEGTGDTSSPDAAINKNVLIAASDTTFPPFEFLKEGEIVGFDIDIINEIASRLEKEIIIDQYHWDPDFKDLQEGKYDLIISAVPYDEEKETVVDFSEPYFSMKYLLLSLIGADITTEEELADKKIGILESGTCCIDEGYLDRFEVLEYADIMVLLEALKNKEIEAILISLPIAVNLLRENEDIYYEVSEVSSDRDFVIVFAKESGLKPQFDSAIKSIKEDGTYDTIYARWFDYASQSPLQQ